MPSRREVVSGTAGMFASAAIGAPRRAMGKSKPRVVVVGGGVGGLAMIAELAGRGDGAFDITLVEPKRIYTTCFYSNLYLGGFQPLEALQHDYRNVEARPGVTHARDNAVAIDRDARRVVLAGGDRLPYDRLVLSPGIALDYDSVPGWSREAAEVMPHAWHAGPRTILLKRQIDAVPDGGVVVVIAPPNPYRCPPGPYERVSMIAHRLKATGKAKARIVILDPKEKFSKQPLFQQGWERLYPGMIEWLPPFIHGGVKRVDATTMTVETDFETYRNAALVNVIPRQTAGEIAVAADLVDESGYCPIDPFNMRARRDERIFVLGDAAIAGDMPKSAFAAGSQASVVAAALHADLMEEAVGPVSYRNRCWSLIGTDNSVLVGGDYVATGEKITQTDGVISTPRDTAEVRANNYADSAAWYSGLTSRLFG